MCRWLAVGRRIFTSLRARNWLGIGLKHLCFPGSPANRVDEGSSPGISGGAIAAVVISAIAAVLLVAATIGKSPTVLARIYW